MTEIGRGHAAGGTLRNVKHGLLLKQPNVIDRLYTLNLCVARVGTAEKGHPGIGAPGGPSEPYIPPPSAEQIAQIDWAIKIKFFNGHVLRRVNGKIYNGLSWQSNAGEVYESENGVLILSQEKRDFSQNSYSSIEYIAITNFPSLPLTDQTVGFVAMKIGIYDMNGHPIALLDCGQPFVPPPPTAEQIKAAQDAARFAAQQEKEKWFLVQSNTVVWLQSQATNGSASAQCSLGEHYLNGQGCASNHLQAVYWLRQAAAQGDIEASNKLANLQF